MNDSCPVIYEDSEAQKEPKEELQTSTTESEPEEQEETIKIEKEELQTYTSQLDDQEITQTDSSEISDNDGRKKRKKKLLVIFKNTTWMEI